MLRNNIRAHVIASVEPRWASETADPQQENDKVKGTPWSDINLAGNDVICSQATKAKAVL